MKKLNNTRVYKYTKAEHVASTLQNNRLMFSRLVKYNDASECSYNLAVSVNSQIGFPIEGLSAPIERAENIIRDQLSRAFTCCFTTIATSNLLWAHYANNHQGVCFEFENDKHKTPLFSDISAITSEDVTYSNVPPNLNLYLGASKEGMLRDETKAVIYTKSIEWAYEHEHRFLTFDTPLTYDRDHIFISFNPRSLKSIILGTNIESSDADIIAEALSHYNSANHTDVNIRHAAYPKGHYDALIVNSLEQKKDVESFSSNNLYTTDWSETETI